MNTLDLEDRFMEQVVRGATWMDTSSRWPGGEHVGAPTARLESTPGADNHGHHAQHRGVGGEASSDVSGRKGSPGTLPDRARGYRLGRCPLSWALAILGWTPQVDL